MPASFPAGCGLFNEKRKLRDAGKKQTIWLGPVNATRTNGH